MAKKSAQTDKEVNRVTIGISELAKQSAGDLTTKQLNAIKKYNAARNEILALTEELNNFDKRAIEIREELAKAEETRKELESAEYVLAV